MLLVAVLVSATAVHAQSLDVIEESLKVSLAPNKEKTVSFSVKNTGTTELDVMFDTSKLDLVDSGGEKIRLSFSPSNLKIAPNKTEKIDLNVKADRLISFERFGGTLEVKDKNSSAKDTLSLTVEVEPDICDFGQVGNALKIDVKEPDSSDDFKPGDIIPIEVDVDNEGQNDIRVQVEAFLFSDNRNIADTSSATKRIDEKEDENFKLRLRIPLDQEDIDENDELTLFIKAFDDEFEQLNCVQERQMVDIQLDDEDIIVDEEETKIFPQAGVCGDVVSASVKVVNIGDQENDNVRVRVEVPALRIREESDKFTLEEFNEGEDNTAVRQFRLKIPDDAQPRKYSMRVVADFEGGSDTLTVPFDVLSCNKPGSIPGQPQLNPVSITIGENAITTKQGAIVTIPVTVVNNGAERMTYIVSVTNIEDFADSSTKKVTVLPGKQSTALMDVIVRERTEEGTYSATVVVRDGPTTISSKNVQVTVGEKKTTKKEADPVAPFLGDIPLWVWVIVNLLLLAVVLLSIKVVIGSLRKR